MGEDKDLISQDEIEKLLQGPPAGAPTPAASGAGQPASPAPSPAPGPSANAPISQDDIEALLSGSAPATKAAASAGPQTPIRDADKRLGQEDIERLLSQAGKAVPPAAEKPAAAKDRPTGPSFPGEGDILSKDIEFLLRQAEDALASIESEADAELPSGVAAFRLEEFAGAPASQDSATLDLIRDVELDLKIELGRTHMYLEDVLKLRRGAVVPLDKLAGDPVDIYVNGRLIARGEVLVLNDNFCVRVAELVAGNKTA